MSVGPKFYKAVVIGLVLVAPLWFAAFEIWKVVF